MSLRFSPASIVLAAIAAIPLAAPLTHAQSPQILAQQVPAKMKSDALALVSVCRADYERLCADVRLGGGRVLACLQQHPNDLSARCGAALPKAEKLKADAVSAGVMPK